MAVHWLLSHTVLSLFALHKEKNGLSRQTVSLLFRLSWTATALNLDWKEHSVAFFWLQLYHTCSRIRKQLWSHQDLWPYHIVEAGLLRGPVTAVASYICLSLFPFKSKTFCSISATRWVMEWVCNTVREAAAGCVIMMPKLYYKWHAEHMWMSMFVSHVQICW